MHFEQININSIDSNHDEFFIRNNNVLDLQNSISTIGLFNPLKVLQTNNHSILISGYRRFRCLLNLNYQTIPCLVYDASHTNKKDAFIISLMDNYFRNYSEYEKALLLKKLESFFSPEDPFFSYALKHILHIDENAINFYRSILELPASILDLLHNDILKIFHIKWLQDLTLEEKIFFSQLFTYIPFTRSQFHKFIEFTQLACKMWDLPTLRSLFAHSALNYFVHYQNLNPKKAAAALLRTLQEIAYPRLSMLLNAFNQRAASFARQDIFIIPPDFLEADKCKIIIEANSMSNFLNKINYLHDTQSLNELDKIFNFAKKTFII